jgi:hypothetical protein
VRKQLFASLFAGSMLLLSLAPAASAQSVTAAPSKPSVIQGSPTINDDSPTGYYLFRSNGDDGIHLRTHGPGAEHDFDATLRTNGTFQNVDPVRLEAGDKVDVLDGGHRLVIHFHTFDFTDGVNFTIKGGEHLRLDLKLDGQPISTDSIFLGQNGRHPKHNPFHVRV